MVLGLIGLSFQFTDLGPTETWMRRIGTIEFVYLFSGLLIGFLYYQKWLIAGLVGWGSVFLVILSLLEGESGFLEVIAIPLITLCLAFGGGYAGALLNTKVFKRFFPGA